ncbi:MAG: uracil-DNA glycosylase [Actinobacteria bacterium]|nr:uracil-DNA glycosylase [Actinomycetota bacterium]MCL5883712.1 uracil-DNA glycosylase [Actinomycetota bacterium]
MSLLTRNLDGSDPLDAETAEKKSREEKLEAVAGYVRVCELCGLYLTRRNAVPGEGDARAGLMLVGESPGENEDIQGRPFVGRSGRQLDEILAAAGFNRESLFITSIVKCRACKPADGRLKNRAPLSGEVSACRPYLVRQVEIVQPRVILCLGASAARGLIDPAFNISTQRGDWFKGPSGLRLIATFHPAYIARGGGAGTDGTRLMKMVRDDMKKIRDYLASAG